MSNKLIVDDRLQYAFRELYKDSESWKAAAKLLGMSDTNYKKIANGEADVITNTYFTKAQPHIQKYLNEWDTKNPKKEVTIHDYIPKESAMPAEIKSTPDSAPNSPLLNLQITAKEFAMLEEFRQIQNSDAQNKAISLIGYWRKMETEKQTQMVNCAEIGETCENAKRRESDRLQGGSVSPHGIPKAS